MGGFSITLAPIPNIFFSPYLMATLLRARPKEDIAGPRLASLSFLEYNPRRTMLIPYSSKASGRSVGIILLISDAVICKGNFSREGITRSTPSELDEGSHSCGGWAG